MDTVSGGPEGMGHLDLLLSSDQKLRTPGVIDHNTFTSAEGPTGKERATLHMQRIVKSVISKQRLNSPFRPMVFPRSFDLAPWVQLYPLSGKRHTDLGVAALGKQTAFVSH